MKRVVSVVLVAGLFLWAAPFVRAQAEKKPQPKAPLPMDLLAESLAQRLSNNLNVKHVVGEPMKVGKVTIIPIMMIDLGFGGGGGGASNTAVTVRAGRSFTAGFSSARRCSPEPGPRRQRLFHERRSQADWVRGGEQSGDAVYQRRQDPAQIGSQT